MRSGVEIWVEYEKAEKLQQVLSTIKSSTFVHFNDETINSADIVGIFKAGTMADYTKRRNGSYQCKFREWHEKGQKCECDQVKDREMAIKREHAIKQCTRGCTGGFKLTTGNSAVFCECVANL